MFWPVLTYLRKGLLRPGSTILSYPKLIVMEKTIAALMLATPRILHPYRRKAQAATAISGLDTTHANKAAVANAVLCLLSEWCPLLLYLGHLVRECNWAGKNNGTGSRAHEVLQLSLCLCCGGCDADRVTTFSSMNAPSCACCCTAASGTKTCPAKHTQRSLVGEC